ncbi:MAG: DUF4160 domain-containing protein [Bacteroidota bacterium]
MKVLIHGIEITIRKREHNPPHFHAMYNDYKAVFSVLSGELTEGHLPAAQLKKIRIWYIGKAEMLLRKWKELNPHLRE